MALEKEFYTIKGLCELLEISESTVHRLMRSGKLKYYKIGQRGTRFRREDIEIYLESISSEING